MHLFYYSLKFFMTIMYAFSESVVTEMYLSLTPFVLYFYLSVLVTKAYIEIHTISYNSLA